MAIDLKRKDKMAKTKFKNISIKGISTILGENEVAFEDCPFYYNDSEMQLKRLQKTIGFNKRFIANSSTTTADLCLEAANKLITEMNINKTEIDAIISVTQTPDYKMPGNAHILHGKLNLKEDCLAIDMEFGCSGFIYGLFYAYSMINSGLKKILLVVGDTLSKVVNQKDKTEAPIFGDAGSAIIIEYEQGANETSFILKSDGKSYKELYCPAGGYRTPSSELTRKEEILEDGSIRSQENFYMNGLNVFNFTITKQPDLVEDILKYAKITKDKIDYFIFHQANNYIVKNIAKKCKLDETKVFNNTFSLFGNQNSASIPCAICNQFPIDKTPKRVLMQGFGIGLSWGGGNYKFS
jgi:3-oxoacyl-[acyl-carrier-protein] synthase-3